MKWILFVLVVGGRGEGMVHSQEFDTEWSCREARRSFMDLNQAFKDGPQVYSFCTAKGKDR